MSFNTCGSRWVLILIYPLKTSWHSYWESNLCKPHSHSVAIISARGPLSPQVSQLPMAPVLPSPQADLSHLGCSLDLLLSGLLALVLMQRYTSAQPGLHPCPLSHLPLLTSQLLPFPIHLSFECWAQRNSISILSDFNSLSLYATDQWNSPLFAFLLTYIFYYFQPSWWHSTFLFIGQGPRYVHALYENGSVGVCFASQLLSRLFF